LQPIPSKRYIKSYRLVIVLWLFIQSLVLTAQELILLLPTDSFAISDAIKNAEIQKGAGDKRTASDFYNRAALIYWEHNYFPEAITYYQKSLKLNEELFNSSGVSMLHNNLGMLHADIKQYNKSLEYFRKALDYRKMVKHSIGIISTQINMSVVLNNLERYTESAALLEDALSLARETYDVNQMKSCYGMLSETYERAGDSEKAKSYFDLYRTFHEKSQLDKEVKNMELVRETGLKLQLAEIETKNKELELSLANSMLKEKGDMLTLASDSARRLYANLSKLELTNQLLEKDILIKDITLENEQKDLQRQRIVNTLLISFLVLFIILLMVLLKGFFDKKRINRKLELQKEEIEKQAAELLETNQKLVELDIFKEGMTGMIVHDLKNPLNTILGNAVNPQALQAAKQMLHMVLNILDVQKFETAKMELQPGNFKLSKIIDFAVGQVRQLYELKAIRIITSVPENSLLFVDYDLICRVYINMLTNAIKYTPANGTITLGHFKTEQNTITLFVEDSGKGIPEAYLDKIFDKFSQVEARDSGNVRSTGLGLSFCKLAVDAHGGSIHAYSEMGKGSTFVFTLPLAQQSNRNFNNDEPVSETIIETADICLSEYEKEMLKPHIEQLKKLSVFEYSKIKNIIDAIKVFENEQLANWKNQLENAVKACNEERYNKLVNI